MNRIPMLTLTQSKLSSAIAWSIVVFFQGLALFFPVRTLPAPLRVVIAVLLAGVIVVILYTTLSTRVEKPDERAALNNYRANSALFNLLFMLFAFFVLFNGKPNTEVFSLTRSQIIFPFAVLNLLHDGLFLAYERFGK